jgi:diaminopimelate decarboxylase
MGGPMPGFSTERGEVVAAGVPLAEIASKAGTPVHVYSAEVIRERYRALDAAFASHPHRLHYAIKANSTLAIVRELRALGARADANSSGELEVGLRAGFAPREIVCTGVGKTRQELEQAVTLGVAAINAESPGEVDRIATIAAAHGVVARVAVRINPDVAAGSHPHISTGHLATKFGMSASAAAALMQDVSRRPSLEVAGLHVHIGSQITRVDPIVKAVATLVDLARHLAGLGIDVKHLDIGGGLGIAYQPDQPIVEVDEYARAVLGVIRGAPWEVVLEPGRWIVGPAGVLVTRVVDMKAHPAGGSFVIVDAGMTDLLRPALYGAWHRIEPVSPRPGSPVRAEVVGPVCETSDTLGHDRELPPLEVDDLLLVRDTGAYGSVMASNYNRRPTAAEVLVDGARWRVIRRRQTIQELLQWDE